MNEILFEPPTKVGRAMRVVLTFLLGCTAAVRRSSITTATRLPSGSLTPALVRLHDTGVIEARQTGETWKGPDGLWRPLLEYRLSARGRAWATGVVMHTSGGGGKRRRTRQPVLADVALQEHQSPETARRWATPA